MKYLYMYGLDNKIDREDQYIRGDKYLQEARGWQLRLKFGQIIFGIGFTLLQSVVLSLVKTSNLLLSMYICFLGFD